MAAPPTPADRRSWPSDVPHALPGRAPDARPVSTLVAGVDSSTQSCKVVIRDAGTGALVREGLAPHPPGTEVDPAAWWDALTVAVAKAGGLADIAAVSVAAQQHGMVCLDSAGATVRPALLWNDTRSAGQAADLVRELGDGDPERGATAWAEAVGSVPVAAFTVTKLRWLAENEPDALARTSAVCLPHDWLTWRLAGCSDVTRLRTDRGDASGTGYWSSRRGRIPARPPAARSRTQRPAAGGARPGRAGRRAARAASGPGRHPFGPGRTRTRQRRQPGSGARAQCRAG